MSLTLQHDLSTIGVDKGTRKPLAHAPLAAPLTAPTCGGPFTDDTKEFEADMGRIKKYGGQGKQFFLSRVFAFRRQC